ncbi:MAG: symmetrical bis(5'-nucleosyl)-tetraphosphatase [Halioglobus sp.]|nr:symmetrical bis(5'-nucleosyl)-tetraphosphatase [Halioglobus sp.]
MSTYVVGDIQGCLQPLKCLLRAVGFNPDQDVLWSVGDLVNRGPKSLKTLRFLYRMRRSLVVVLGNHDLHLLAVAAGVRSPGRSDTLDRILQAPDREELLNWLVQQPLMHHEHGFTMVHAGIPPQWSVKQALGYAAEVEAVLRSPDCVTFLKAMYGNEPAQWSDDLSGMTRLRVITNYLTRMRYCTADGTLDLESKGSSPTPGAANLGNRKVSAWFSHPQRKTANDRILFGHWATLAGMSSDPNAIALDTGCVWNGAMSLYHLESGTWTRCACHDGRCREHPAAAQA